MSIFNDIKKNAEKLAKADSDKREKAAMEGITAVLEAENCELVPVMRYAPFGIAPDLEIRAKPPKTDDQPPKPGDAGPSADTRPTAPEAPPK